MKTGTTTGWTACGNGASITFAFPPNAPGWYYVEAKAWAGDTAGKPITLTVLPYVNYVFADRDYLGYGSSIAATITAYPYPVGYPMYDMKWQYQYRGSANEAWQTPADYTFANGQGSVTMNAWWYPGYYLWRAVNGTQAANLDWWKYSQAIIVLKATLTYDPRNIAAETEFAGINDDQQRSTITVAVQPSQIQSAVIDEITVEVSRIFGGSYDPGKGSLTRNSGNHAEWLYTPFAEPKTERHPTSKNVWFVAKYKGRICSDDNPISIFVVKPVFLFFTTGYFGTGGKWHTPTDSDYNLAWPYAKWKYSISTPDLTSIGYDESLPFGTRAQTFTLTGSCSLGLGAMSDEGWCASALGHEQVHGNQGYPYCVLHQVRGPNHYEVPAYQWEIDHAVSTGISSAQLQIVTAWRDYYNGTTDTPPSRD